MKYLYDFARKNGLWLTAAGANLWGGYVLCNDDRGIVPGPLYCVAYQLSEKTLKNKPKPFSETVFSNQKKV